MTDTAPLMTGPEIDALFEREFPQARQAVPGFVIEAVVARGCRLRMPYDARHLRPGGTISGPAMFTLADLALYVALLGTIGPVALAVTTSMTINFLRKPAQADLLADCRLMKVGKQFIVGEVDLLSAGAPDIVAHAVGTYAVPPRRA